MHVSSWVSGLPCFMQHCDWFFSSSSVSTRADHSCLKARGRWGDKNRKALTANCPPLDQISQKNQACLCKGLLPVFTASTHFCFTTSKLLGRLFSFTWTVSVRATLADESSRGWHTGSLSLMDTKGCAGSERLGLHSIQMHRQGLSASSSISMFPSKERSCFRQHRREEAKARHLPIHPTTQTGSVFQTREWITGKEKELTV